MAGDPLPGRPHERQRLINSGQYTEAVMTEAERIFWDTEPRRAPKTRFETWPEFGQVHNNVQSHFAKLARLVLDQ